MGVWTTDEDTGETIVLPDVIGLKDWRTLPEDAQHHYDLVYSTVFDRFVCNKGLPSQSGILNQFLRLGKSEGFKCLAHNAAIASVEMLINHTEGSTRHLELQWNDWEGMWRIKSYKEGLTPQPPVEERVRAHEAIQAAVERAA